MYRRAASVPLMPPFSSIPQAGLAPSYSNTLLYPPMGPQPTHDSQHQPRTQSGHFPNPMPQTSLQLTHPHRLRRLPPPSYQAHSRILPPTSGPCAQAELEVAMQEETDRLQAALEKEAAERNERERRMAEEVLRTELEKARAAHEASKERARTMRSRYEGFEEEVMEDNQSLKKELETMHEEFQNTKETLHEVTKREKEATRLLEIRTQKTHQLGRRIQRLVESVEERDEAVDKYTLLLSEVWAKITEKYEQKREKGKERYAREREKREKLGQQEPERVFKAMKEHLAKKKEKEKVEDEATVPDVSCTVVKAPVQEVKKVRQDNWEDEVTEAIQNAEKVNRTQTVSVDPVSPRREHPEPVMKCRTQGSLRRPGLNVRARASQNADTQNDTGEPKKKNKAEECSLWERCEGLDAEFGEELHVFVTSTGLHINLVITTSTHRGSASIIFVSPICQENRLGFYNSDAALGRTHGGSLLADKSRGRYYYYVKTQRYYPKVRKIWEESWNVRGCQPVRSEEVVVRGISQQEAKSMTPSLPSLDDWIAGLVRELGTFPARRHISGRIGTTLWVVNEIQMPLTGTSGILYVDHWSAGMGREFGTFSAH
ncbi:hypothetical protein BDZ91DRAFT_764220 [Kalaharituber pfeilii]|nr:hypothetical protein BDZ91DRAFT_764220 [Kalaharituber pfeilii]